MAIHTAPIQSCNHDVFGEILSYLGNEHIKLRVTNSSLNRMVSQTAEKLLLNCSADSEHQVKRLEGIFSSFPKITKLHIVCSSDIRKSTLQAISKILFTQFPRNLSSVCIDFRKSFDDFFPLGDVTTPAHKKAFGKIKAHKSLFHALTQSRVHTLSIRYPDELFNSPDIHDQSVLMQRLNVNYNFNPLKAISRNHNLRNLTLHQLPSAMMFKFFQSAHQLNLTSLVLSNNAFCASYEEFKTFLQKNASLYHFNFASSRFYLTAGGLSAVNEHLRDLTSTSIRLDSETSSENLIDFVRNIPNMMDLTFITRHHTGIVEQVLSELIENTPYLKKFTVGSSSDAKILEDLPGVSLSCCSSISMTIGQNFPFIFQAEPVRKLILNKCSHVDLQLAHNSVIPNEWSQLEAFAFTDNLLSTPTFMYRCLIPHLTALRRLKIQVSSSFSDFELNLIAQHIPQLQRLQITAERSLKRVSNAGIDTLLLNNKHLVALGLPKSKMNARVLKIICVHGQLQLFSGTWHKELNSVVFKAFMISNKTIKFMNIEGNWPNFGKISQWMNGEDSIAPVKYGYDAFDHPL